MQNIVTVFACLYAGVNAQIQCSPPDEQTNPSFVPDPEDCHSYYRCDNGVLVHVTCPDGLVWNQELKTCDFQWSTPCSPAMLPPSTKSFVHVQEFHEWEIHCPPPTPDGHYNATYYPDDTDCHKYFECDNGVLKNLTCPDNLVWSQDLLVCDHEWNTLCTTERRRHVVPALPITRKAAGKKAAPYTHVAIVFAYHYIVNIPEPMFTLR